jgi:hypothetical protein
MKYFLDQIESKLQSFIEGASQVSPWDEYQVQLGRRLVQSLVGAMEEGTSGDLIVPHHYYISLHPNNATFWLGRQDLLNNLANSLQEAAVEQGVQFLLAPVIHITPDPTLDKDGLIVRIDKEEIKPGIADTAAIPIEVRPDENDHETLSPFLIIEGREAFPVIDATVKIGRNPENDLILNDPRISRRHAQLLSRQNHHILIDLGSTGGTFVNGQRITKQVLRPGDVISLAGVTIVYYEETAAETGKLTLQHDQEVEDLT